jgi:hypothetical protein
MRRRPLPAVAQQSGHQPVRARQLAEEPARFLLGEDGGQALGAFGAHGVDGAQVLVEHLAVEEEKSAFDRLYLSCYTQVVIRKLSVSATAKGG